MVDEISPTHYASGATVGEYVLSGVNFHYIPEDAVGIIAFDNDAPLANIDAQPAFWLFDIGEKTDTRMTMHQRETSTHGDANYLGAIVSADRQTVYWVNETRPLP